MTSMEPEQVLHNWIVPELANITKDNITKPTSGLLNKTFLIRPSNGSGLFVLQCVHPAVSVDGAMNNYFHVTQFLREQGLPAQEMLRTESGALWVENGDHWRWRLFRGVEGEFYDSIDNTDMAEQGGRMLGQFHNTLSQYPKELEIGRPLFLYDQEIAKLGQFENRLMVDPNETIQETTQFLMRELPKLKLPSDLPKRIIHADPKVSNFAFSKEGQAVSMIDLDTIQQLSPLYDLGDALRSWCGQKEDDPNNTFNFDIYKAFMKGYLDTSKNLLSEQEQSLVPQACKLVILGLTTRFLNDYIEDSYFGWDETRYDSRKAHNKARVAGQLSLYMSAIKSI